MPPGDFAFRAKSQLPRSNSPLIAFGDVNLPAGKFTGSHNMAPLQSIFAAGRVKTLLYRSGMIRNGETI